MSKHTPGPWKVETYHGPMFKIIRDRNKDELPQYSTDADARLIAAAPEMLEAIKNEIDSLCGCEEVSSPDGPWLDRHQCTWCELIAKAEGREK